MKWKDDEMAVTFTMTWVGGQDSDVNIGFVLTDDRARVTPWVVPVHSINNVPDPVARAVAEEIHNQGGAATGTVTVSI